MMLMKLIIDDIETALDANKETLGYVITVTAKDGSQGSITFSVGIKNDGTVNGYSITSISETPGLGMKAEEADFYKQFENKKVDKFDVVKATPSKDDEIEAITGSTITSKAMANGCNAAITWYVSYTGCYIQCGKRTWNGTFHYGGTYMFKPFDFTFQKSDS